MNKTIKTIAIVFLVLGGLAAIAGVVIGFSRGRLISRLPAIIGQQHLPNYYRSWQPMGGRNRGDMKILVFKRGFFAIPGWLIASGITFLIAGAVLLIFNHKISSSVETPKETDEKIAKSQAAPIKKTVELRNKTTKKTT